MLVVIVFSIKITITITLGDLKFYSILYLIVLYLQLFKRDKLRDMTYLGMSKKRFFLHGLVKKLISGKIQEKKCSEIPRFPR
jgi:hypothetical protein